MPDTSPAPTSAALDFLLTRRSRPAKSLTGPWPDRAALRPILTAAARTPDHGKLEPWRFVVLAGAATDRLAAVAHDIGTQHGRDPEQVAKFADQFARSGLCVAVIASPKPSDKIPAIEQTLSAGAVCLSLLNAALASGWGANWLTGWGAHDPAFRAAALDLAPHEFVAGFIHIGTESAAPPDRPRPAIDAITDWHDA